MPYQHYWLLLLWTAIGACLRLINLGTLPPWTDESATMVFSLGNSFYDVPLNEFIGLQTLIEPLQFNPDAGINNVIDLLLTESTHPPLYFVLTHWWLKLFSPTAGLVSLSTARSLSALFGVIGIPAIFYFAKFAFRSLIVAQITAAMMAVSPLGIFLAVQARHYTLVILLVIASLFCFVAAFRSVSGHEIIPWWLVFTWIVVNCLGIATHYFFVLTLAAIAISFVPSIWQQWRQDRTILAKPQWRRIYVVALGSLIGCLVWLPVLETIRDRSPTDWIYQSNAATRWLEPIGRFLLWLMSMVILLPSSLYDYPLGIIIVSGLLTLVFWIYYLPRLIYGLKLQRDTDKREAVIALSRYLLATIAIFFFSTYIGGMDLTLAGRFHFVYLPVVIPLIAVSLSSFWQRVDKLASQHSWLNSIKDRNQRIVVVFLCVGLFSGAIANLNRGYLQNHRPDLMTDRIVAGSNAPIAVATTYRHHGQTGRIIGLAWGLKDLPNIDTPQFFLATEDEPGSDRQSVEIMQQELAKIKRPLDLWLVNFDSEVDLTTQNCLIDSEDKGIVGQYKYQLYRCRN